MRQYTDQITYLNQRMETLIDRFLARSRKRFSSCRGIMVRL